MVEQAQREDELVLAPRVPGQVPEPILVSRDLSKTYGQKKAASAVRALQGVNLEFERGRLTAIMGPSGSGKTTLLQCLAGLDRPTAGSVELEGKEITRMKPRQLSRLRRDQIGFIFQSPNLVPTLTAQENITLPADIARNKAAVKKVAEVASALGISDRLNHLPEQLSGGQQQRVACARALLTAPAIIFADEPTGNLDSRAGRQVLQYLRAAVDRSQQTVLMVTHDADAAAWADRVVFLQDGAVVGELEAPTPDTVLLALKQLRGKTEVSPGGARLEWIPRLSPMRTEPQFASPAAQRAQPPQTVQAAEERTREDEVPNGPVPAVATATAARASRPSATEPSAMEPSATEPSATEPNATDPSGTQPRGDAAEVAAHLPEGDAEPAEPEDAPAPAAPAPAAPAAPLPLEVALQEIAPAAPLPEEMTRVINQAQQILEDLPGSVVQDEPQSSPAPARNN